MNPEPSEDLRLAAFVFLIGLGVMAVLIALLVEIGR